MRSVLRLPNNIVRIRLKNDSSAGRRGTRRRADQSVAPLPKRNNKALVVLSLPSNASDVFPVNVAHDEWFVGGRPRSCSCASKAILFTCETSTRDGSHPGCFACYRKSFDSWYRRLAYQVRGGYIDSTTRSQSMLLN